MPGLRLTGRTAGYASTGHRARAGGNLCRGACDCALGQRKEQCADANSATGARTGARALVRAGAKEFPGVARPRRFFAARRCCPGRACQAARPRTPMRRASKQNARHAPPLTAPFLVTVRRGRRRLSAAHPFTVEARRRFRIPGGYGFSAVEQGIRVDYRPPALRPALA